MKQSLENFQPNKKNGVTISVKKYGGWSVSYPKATQLAGWTSPKAGSVGGA